MKFLPTISTIVENRDILDNNSMSNQSNIDSLKMRCRKKLDSVNFKKYGYKFEKNKAVIIGDLIDEFMKQA